MAFSQNAKSSIPRPGGVPPTKGAPAAAMVEPGVRRPAVDGAAVTDGLKTRLAAVLHGKESVSAGCFHLVGLAEVRKRLGPSWERVQDKVHAQTRRIIERHIAPRDVYFPNGPEDYVLVFAAMGKLAAQAVCAASFPIAAK